jgi:hypothetical protein
MKNQFILKKNAFVTCFTPFVSSINKRDVIAYSALLKEDIPVDFNRVKFIFPKLGIEELNINYIVKNNYDIEFLNEIIEFEKNNSAYNSNYKFRVSSIEVYFEYILNEYIDVYKGEFNTQNSLFIFYGFD